MEDYPHACPITTSTNLVVPLGIFLGAIKHCTYVECVIGLIWIECGVGILFIEGMHFIENKSLFTSILS